MFSIHIKNIEDFKNLLRKEKTVFRKKDQQGNHYYVISKLNEIPLLFRFSSEKELEFSLNFEFEDEKIIIDNLIDICDLTFLYRTLP